jgi:hypothetical protein
VTNAILGDDGAVAAADAGALLQIKAILQQLAVSDQTLADDGAIHEALTRTLLLPGGIFPLLGQSGPTAESSAEREDSSLKAGLSVSGSYGPIVEFKATTDFATSTAKEEASKVGTKYSKDVTTRATSKIIEKNRRQVVTRFVTKVSEKSVHGFGNVKGDASIPTGRASPSSERRSIRDCAKRRGQAAHRWSRHVHAPCRRRRARGRSAATKASSMRPTSSSRPAPFIRR